MDVAVQRKELERAAGILDEQGIDCWPTFARETSETRDDARHAFCACIDALEADRRARRAGVQGRQVDAAARQGLTSAGFPEYRYALGHSVGMACHDGGPISGPRSPRYGAPPERAIGLGTVYTLELGIATERGYVGLEDEVLASASWAAYISPAQRELPSYSGSRCAG